MNLNDITINLQSGDLKNQAAAFEAIQVITSHWAGVAIEAMKESKNPFLIAERLPLLGSSCIDRLRAVLLEDVSTEVRVLAALLLLSIGDHSGLPEALEEIRNVGKYACIAVKLVRTSFIPQAPSALIEGLSKLDINQVDFVVAYLETIKKLEIDLPEDLKRSFRGGDSPWQIKSYFN